MAGILSLPFTATQMLSQRPTGSFWAVTLFSAPFYLNAGQLTELFNKVHWACLPESSVTQADMSGTATTDKPIFGHSRLSAAAELGES